MNRNESRDEKITKSESYSSFLNQREMKSITHYISKEYNYPTEDEISELNLIPITWKFGEKFFKLASKYYNDPSLWFLIAFYNKKPTDLHVKNGELIYIPMPPDKLLVIMEK